jgi:hypothetical protein
MKAAGILVMPAGFFLVLAALVLFPDPVRRDLFVACGVLVEALGLAVALRAAMLERGPGSGSGAGPGPDAGSQQGKDLA